MTLAIPTKLIIPPVFQPQHIVHYDKSRYKYMYANAPIFCLLSQYSSISHNHADTDSIVLNNPHPQISVKFQDTKIVWNDIEYKLQINTNSRTPLLKQITKEHKCMFPSASIASYVKYILLESGANENF